VPLNIEIIAGHRLGWIGPSVFQQSLLATGALLWGDRAALDSVPNWRPEQIDPRDALDEMGCAERHLADGNGVLAAHRAAGALLIARRTYTAHPGDWATRLSRVWPEAPETDSMSPQQFVAGARALLEDWLFTWEGSGMSKDAIKQFEALRK
ncbi:MAG TPA: hypothetical protein VGW38_11795, partial [Chloroflexota bacterium]|nr:hypothetical protein [Chloroflexota bacterium]